MRVALKHILKSIVIAVLLLQAGCGALQLWWYAPDNEREDWSEWKQCFGKPLSKVGITHSVFCLEGERSKPPLLLLHELNGLTPETFRYATELSKDFTVYIPMLFGTKGEESGRSGFKAYWFNGFINFFPHGEWGVPSDGSAPIVSWLREVAAEIQAQDRTKRLRIIGNCMTGALPLALLSKANGDIDENIEAVVVSQPALPMKFWWYTDHDHKSLGLSKNEEDLAVGSKAKILGLRFETDRISHPEKMNTLQSKFRGRFTEAEICAKDYEYNGTAARAHSTLIGERDTIGQIGELSKRARQQVREWLIDSSIPIFTDVKCASR